MTSVAAAAAWRVRDATEGRWPAVAVGLGVGPVLAVNGGYFATSWGWAAMALAWAAVLGVAFTTFSRPSTPELVFIGGLTAFAGWLVVSNLWTQSPTQTPLELERTLVYVAATLAVLTLVPREQVRAMLGAACMAMTAVCFYGLATRLFPSGFGAPSVLAGLRLASPVGYWNGLGLVAVMAFLLAAVFVARARTLAGRALAGVALPLLAVTLYFTFSRGAWLALFAGVVVLVAADRARTQLVLSLLPASLVSAFAVWRASREHALTHFGASLNADVHQGHSLAIVLLVACVVAAVATVAVSRLGDADARMPVVLRRAVLWLGVAAAVVVVSATIVRYGSPVTIARHAYHSFTRTPPKVGTDVSKRLFSLSNNGRLSAWRVALHAFEAKPVAGIGAGGFERYWFQHRAVADTIRDAHSLYLETLAEAGLIGAALLFAALLAPFAILRRARQNPLAAGALAAYTAYLVAAAVDWDWELSGVTLGAVLCAGALFAAGRAGEPAPERWRRAPLVLGSVVAVAALIGLAGNLTLAATSRALHQGKWQRAATDARRAELWAPWSSEPWQRLGEAQLQLGQVAKARGSFSTAVSKSPGDWTAWVDLARASSGTAQAAAFAHARRLSPLEPTIGQLQSQLHGKPQRSSWVA
jgi:hypothetical protein